MLTKYQWGEACRAFPGFRDTPGVIRLAWALCELFNEEVGCAWPTRETLSANLNAPPQSISKWLKALSDGGAIACLPISAVPQEYRQRIGRKANRAQVYTLNFGWASSVLSHRDEVAFNREVSKVTTSRPLNLEGNGSATLKGNDAATLKGRGTVTLIPYEHTLDHTVEEKGGREVSDLGVYTREAPSNHNTYAKAKGKVA